LHGDHVQYSTAATVRSPDIRMPMAYCLAWDLMQWAHTQGARFFDFGGITEGTQGGPDPLGGISDFKRYFKGTVADVGEEWILEPHPAAAAVNRIVHRLRPGSRPG
jgi:lipid II:glycine glycyltransferase (peptidoglycan interpeptide bridge formation enzyme)